MKEKDFKNWNMFKILFSYFPKHIHLFILDLCCAFLVSAIDLAYPLVSRKAMYDLLPNQAYKAFFVIMGVVIGAYLVKAALQYVVTYWGHTFGIRVEADIRQDLFEHMQLLSFDFYDNNRTGALMSRLTSDLFEISELSHHGPEDILISIACLVGSLVIIFSMQPVLGWVILTLIPIFILVAVARRKHMRAANIKVKANIAVINTEIESSLSGMRTSKAFANEAVELEKFKVANGKFRTSKKDFHQQMAIFQSIMEFFTSITGVVVMIVGGYLIMEGKMNYIDLITFTLYVSSFTNPVRRLTALAEQLSTATAGLERFINIMRTEPTVKDKPEAKELGDIEGTITIENVDFSYKCDLPVLNNINVEIKPGETVAIVGPSGGGKTTLCSLLPRFYDVNSGAIRIDGTDIRDVTQKSLRSQIGVVQQDVFLFADSIANNIRYGKADASDEEIIEAAKKAEIYDDIMAMPDKFDTYVGERGALLSGGQKQRIAIARIFLKNPPVLILDEATSALDTITEAKIQSAFDALSIGRTTLIIAHRLSTIRNASRIFVIDEGILKEQGNHNELMALDGIYANLYNTQTKLHS